MASSQVTTNHDVIREWAERHQGSPAHVKGTGSGDDPGILRIDFPGFSGEESLEHIDWEQFFEWFEKNNLALVYRDEDRFNKLVSRDTAASRAKTGQHQQHSSR